MRGGCRAIVGKLGEPFESLRTERISEKEFEQRDVLALIHELAKPCVAFVERLHFAQRLGTRIVVIKRGLFRQRRDDFTNVSLDLRIQLFDLRGGNTSRG